MEGGENVKKRATYLSIIIVILLTSFLMSGCVLPFMGNEPVTIASKPRINAVVGVLYKYQLDIEDDSKTRVVITLPVSPEGMTIDGTTGLIMWTPTEEQVGEHEVKIRVNDGWYRDEQEFTITVIPFQLKSITIKPTTMNFTGINQNRDIESITANYTDDTSKVVDRSECNFKSNNDSVATVDEEGKVKSIAKGSTTISVSYTEEGITKSATITVSVTIPTTTSSGGG